MEKARPHTAPEALEKCVASEFLARCLAKAGFDAELCGDVTDACEVAELNALDLASGDLSSEEVASRLFLVDTEAKCVRVYVCVCLSSHAAGLSLCRWQQQLMPLTSDGTWHLLCISAPAPHPAHKPLPQPHHCVSVTEQEAVEGVHAPVRQGRRGLWVRRGGWGVKRRG